jgi:hypothetical protein
MNYKASMVDLVLVKTRCRFMKAWVSRDTIPEAVLRGVRFGRASRLTQDLSRSGPKLSAGRPMSVRGEERKRVIYPIHLPRYHLGLATHRR